MSLVNQMLRDLELRQSGQLAADGALLCDIGAVHESLPASVSPSSWRPIGIVLVIAAVAALLASVADTRWTTWPRFAAGTDDGAPAGFVSVVRPASPETGSRAEMVSAGSQHEIAGGAAGAPVQPPEAAHRPEASPAGAAAPAPGGRPVLRFARELGAVPVLTTDGVTRARSPAAPRAEKSGKATLPEELSAVAARFDSDFAASLSAAGDAPTRQPSPVLVAAAPLKVKSATRRSAAVQGQELYVVAAAALAAGRRGDAENNLLEALRVEPSHVQARRLLATMLLQSGRLQAADRLLADAPVASAEIAGLRARVLVELGRDAEALAALEPTVESSADINQHAFHAALLQRLGDHTGASIAYRRVLAAQPDNGVWWMGLGISLEALQQPADARLAYDRARASGRLQQALAEFVERRLATL